MKQAGTSAEVFVVFLRLGLSSFGGPVAHLGYFRTAFVDRRRWLSAPDYAAIVSLCQFLPGPASSQTGFCIGLTRAGWRGGLAAWAGFTLPSALAMFAAAEAAPWLAWSPLAGRVLHGLQLAAVAVVAQAVLRMARAACPDRRRRLLACAAFIAAVAFPGFASQLAILLLSGAVGWFAAARPAGDARGPELHGASFCLITFFGLLLLSLFHWRDGRLALFAAFYRTGALVFGGGHVVLPLLQTAVVTPGWVDAKTFLAGYGAAQALPGPLFAISAYLGTVSRIGPGGLAGATLALVGIFLPGLLLAAGLLPRWHAARMNTRAAAAMESVNAGVVGLLAATLPVLARAAGHRPVDVAIVALATVALTAGQCSALAVVILCAAVAILIPA